MKSKSINIFILIIIIFTCSCRAIMEPRVKQRAAWFNINVNISVGDKSLYADKKTDVEAALDVAP